MTEIIRVEEVIIIVELMEQFAKMNKDNSIRQIFIPGIGKFTIVLQEEDRDTIASDVRDNLKLRHMINESLEEYKNGNTVTTADLIASLSIKDFENEAQTCTLD